MSVTNGVKTGFVLLILPFFVFSCSSTKQASKPPPFRVAKITLAKGIDDKAIRREGRSQGETGTRGIRLALSAVG